MHLPVLAVGVQINGVIPIIRSMTGYGRAQLVEDGMNITLELKSVNHRYLEFNSRLPRNYGFLDEKLKSFFMEKVTRGKLECYVSIETIEEPDIVVEANHPLIESYLKVYDEIAKKHLLRNNIKLSDVVKVPEVLTLRKQAADEERIWAAVRVAATEATEKFIEMRQVEGERLKEDISARLDTVIERIAFVEENSSETVNNYHEKLLAKLKEMLEDTHIDEQRILTEAAIFADKISTAEETVRLRSHISQMKEFLEADEAIGKKMDFLVQEMNREANTIGSKCNDVTIARAVVDIKAEIEKIREQIQNIE